MTEIIGTAVKYERQYPNSREPIVTMSTFPSTLYLFLYIALDEVRGTNSSPESINLTTLKSNKILGNYKMARENMLISHIAIS